MKGVDGKGGDLPRRGHPRPARSVLRPGSDRSLTTWGATGPHRHLRTIAPTRLGVLLINLGTPGRADDGRGPPLSRAIPVRSACGGDTARAVGAASAWRDPQLAPGQISAEIRDHLDQGRITLAGAQPASEDLGAGLSRAAPEGPRAPVRFCPGGAGYALRTAPRSSRRMAKLEAEGATACSCCRCTRNIRRAPRHRRSTRSMTTRGGKGACRRCAWSTPITTIAGYINALVAERQRVLGQEWPAGQAALFFPRRAETNARARRPVPLPLPEDRTAGRHRAGIERDQSDGHIPIAVRSRAVAHALYATDPGCAGQGAPRACRRRLPGLSSATAWRHSRKSRRRGRRRSSRREAGNSTTFPA